MEVQCSAPKNVIPRSSDYTQLIEEHIKFHRNQTTRQASRDKAGAYFLLSCAIPLLTLAIARW